MVAVTSHCATLRSIRCACYTRNMSLTSPNNPTEKTPDKEDSFRWNSHRDLVIDIKTTFQLTTSHVPEVLILYFDHSFFCGLVGGFIINITNSSGATEDRRHPKRSNLFQAFAAVKQSSTFKKTTQLHICRADNLLKFSSFGGGFPGTDPYMFDMNSPDTICPPDISETPDRRIFDRQKCHQKHRHNSSPFKFKLKRQVAYSKRSMFRLPSLSSKVSYESNEG